MLTRPIRAGGLTIGGGSPVVIQSMTNTDTRDISATAAQIRALAEAGCELVRVAVPDMEAADAIPGIKKLIGIPLAADVHFNHRLAVRAVENGADKLRINPGNIGGIDGLRRIVSICAERGVPIRVGANSGSLGKNILKKFGGATAEAIVASALEHIGLLEGLGFDKIIVAVKSSNVPVTFEAYTLLSKKTDYPLHLGVTEAGGAYSGTVKSAVGIGALLLNGIGDTIRVSLTGDPLEEIRAAKEILRAAGRRRFGVEIISCPACGRSHADLARLAALVEKGAGHIKKDVTIAVMGCEVNGPGEARGADIGIACGKGCGLVFANGEIIKKITGRGTPGDPSYEESLAEEFLRIAEDHI